MGQYFAHALIALDDQGHMRECTVSEEYMKKEGNQSKIFNMQDKRFKIYSDDFFHIRLASVHLDLPGAFNPVLLANLLPGITDHGKDKDADGVIDPEEVCVFSKGTDDEVARLTIRDESRRYLLDNIADQAKSMQGFYILNAYQNIERYEPISEIVFNYNNISTNGSMCSGLVWWADKKARAGMGGEMSIQIVDSQTIADLAYSMFDGIRPKLYDIIDKSTDKDIHDLVPEDFEYFMLHAAVEMPPLSYSKYIVNQVIEKMRHYLLHDYDLPTKMANQLINTFLFNRSDDISDYWRDHLNEAVGSASVSPDNLLMVGMPTPINTFTGIQTANSSFYDAIENYKSCGGYYTKFTAPGEVTAPVDPRTGEPPSICVYENAEITHILQNGGELTKEFEIIPIPEELGGRHSQDLDFSINNKGVYTPLELTGAPPVSISGASQFNIFYQPLLAMIDGGARTKFGLEFAFDPSHPGMYSTVISIPNSDENNAAYSCTLRIKGINESYFIDNPIYYNQCENEDDLFNPLIGAKFGSKAVESRSGDYAGFAYLPGKFNNGYRVVNRNRNGGRYGQALVYPFGDTLDEDKPDLSRGTCAFWADAHGEWRHKDDDTAVDSMMLFSLVDAVTTGAWNDPHLVLFASADSHGCSVSFYGDYMSVAGTTTVNQNEIASFVLQWDLADGFSDGTNIRCYCNGDLVGAAHTSLTIDKINESAQMFLLKSWTRNGGDHRVDDSHASIDNIIFWNKIVDAESIAAIYTPKDTLL